MPLWERCMSGLLPRALAVSLYSSITQYNRQRIDHGLKAIKRHSDLFRGSMVMINTAPFFENMMEVPPNQVWHG